MADYALGATIDLKFTTALYGVPTALAGSPAVSVYQGGNTTEITAGVTFSGSYDSRVGLNDISIVATSGNGFADGYDYQVVLTAGTLGGVSVVGQVVGAFSIGMGNVSNIGGDAVAITNLHKTTNAIPRGTVTTGGSTTSIPTSALSIAGSAASGVVADQFVGRVVLFDGATTTAGLRGASSAITASTASNTPTLTVDPALPATPASGDLFSVV